MNILITGGNFKNKGAELMLMSLIYKINARIPDSKIYVSPLLGNKHKLSNVGVGYVDYPLYHYGHKRLSLSLHAPALIRTVMKLKGIATEGTIPLKKIDVVFDISGFAFGDKWGDKPLSDLYHFIKKMKGYGAKFFLLPQAFGPFTKRGMKEHISKASLYVDLLIARDKTSYAYVINAVGGERQNILLYPDITLTFKVPRDKQQRLNSKNYCLIVPNERMLDKASESWQRNYIEVMSKIIQHILLNSKLDVIVLIHAQGDSNDAKVGKDIIDSVPLASERLSFLIEEDPITLKAFISACDFLVGSRFHALASALSSNVPALATSWLHKYEMLFEDYQCSDFSFKEPNDQLFDSLGRLLDTDSRNEIIKRLQHVNEHMKAKSEDMWDKIGEHIG